MTKLNAFTRSDKYFIVEKIAFMLKNVKKILGMP